MGVGLKDSAWRFTNINQAFQYSPTYPRILAVPSRISDNVLKHMGGFRSKSRIPALSYIHQCNKMTITRSSQPMTGLSQQRSIQDEKLVEAIFSSDFGGHTSRINYIMDARPHANALAQTAMGAGTESQDHYRNSKVVYLNVENIHVVRECMTKLMDGKLNLSVACLNTEGIVSKAAIDKSGWLKHIQTIIDGTFLIVRAVSIEKTHVLVHCRLTSFLS